MRQFSLRSKGIPLGVTPVTATAMIRSCFFRQPVTRESLDEMACTQGNVCKFVDSYGSAEDACEWESFFKTLIPDNPIARGTVPVEECEHWLLKLYNEFGGPPRRKSTEHLRERLTLSTYTEPCTWPTAPWSQLDRDQSAEYAIATDVNSSLVLERTDLKRKRKKTVGAKPVPLPSRKGAKKKPGKSVSIHLIRSDCDSDGSMQSPKKKPRGRPPKAKPRHSDRSDTSLHSKANIDIDDCMSACSSSTGASTYAPSMKSGDDSDIGSFKYWEPSTCDESSVITDNSDYSYIDLDSIPKNMKGKDIAETYWNMIGRRFQNAEDDEVYRIVNVCEYDFGRTGMRMLEKLCYRFALADLTEVTTDDLEIGLCTEMMDCDWVDWLPDDDEDDNKEEEINNNNNDNNK